MSDDDEFYLIIADRIDDTQRRLIHHAIKTNTDEWWHEFLDAWIVKGKNTREWSEILGPFVPVAPSQLLILGLPALEDRIYGLITTDPKKRAAWLRRVYHQSEPPNALPATD